jgi:hypothetical protein
LKEDISAGTFIPLNFLFGRAESGGIGGEGALTAERSYLQVISNIQKSFSDDILFRFGKWGFDVAGLDIRWNLSLQKTREQELKEQAMEEQLKQLKINTSMLRLQKRQLQTQVEMGEAQASLQLAMGLQGQMAPAGGEESDEEESPAAAKPRKAAVASDFVERHDRIMESSDRLYKSIMGTKEASR